MNPFKVGDIVKVKSHDEIVDLYNNNPDYYNKLNPSLEGYLEEFSESYETTGTITSIIHSNNPYTKADYNIQLDSTTCSYDHTELDLIKHYYTKPKW
jgi:hypothetical protein